MADGPSFVLRAYDNRVRETPRSPFLYRNYDGLKNDTKDVVKVVDGGNGQILEFGELSGTKALSTIFAGGDDRKRGKVEVISVPFYEGSHECTSIQQAIEVIDWTSKLHDKGFVHGDIRGFNLIFSEEANASRPIDFDFGGISNKVKFPPGYQNAPGDVTRNRSKPGNPIVPIDDFRALSNVFTEFHEPILETSDEMVLAYEVRTATSLTELSDSFDALLRIRNGISMKASYNYEQILKKAKQVRGGVLPKVEQAATTIASTDPRSAAISTPLGAQHTPNDMAVVTGNRDKRTAASSQTTFMQPNPKRAAPSIPKRRRQQQPGGNNENL